MFPLVDALTTDVRQSVRRIFRTPWLSAIVILALTPAIAANTTIFSLLKLTVLQKLPVPDPDALVFMEGSDIRTNLYSAIYFPTLKQLQQGRGAFESLAAYLTTSVRVESGAVNISTGAEGVSPE